MSPSCQKDYDRWDNKDVGNGVILSSRKCGDLTIAQSMRCEKMSCNVTKMGLVTDTVLVNCLLRNCLFFYYNWLVYSKSI
jgi:hypothetical protein